jgi:hypothetical protein
MDFKIKGGATGSQPSCPLWKGGDLSEKSDDACVYVSVNSPTYQGVCASANACSGSYQVGVPKAIQDCNSGTKDASYPLVMVSAPKGFPDTFTSYKASGSSKSSSSKSSSKSSTSKSSSSTGSSNKQVVKASTAKKCSSKLKKRRNHSRRAAPRFLGREYQLS